MIYVASSWRNDRFDDVLFSIRDAGFEAYDFKHPPCASGFHWSEVSVGSNGDTAEHYLRGLQHPRSQQGFASDFDAMKASDTCVLVLPCGRSAHLELGWCAGRGKRTAILLDPDPITPELMYLIADKIAVSIADLLNWLKESAVDRDAEDQNKVLDWLLNCGYGSTFTAEVALGTLLTLSRVKRVLDVLEKRNTITRTVHGDVETVQLMRPNVGFIGRR